MVHRQALPFPLVAGKTEADARIIADRFQSEPDAYAESRRRLGVIAERAYLQTTPMGLFVVAYIESDRPSAATMTGLAQSDLEIDRFFRDTVRELHGIDLTLPPQGPPPENVGEWVDPAVGERRRGMAFCAPIVPEMLDRGREWARTTFASEGMTASRRALGQNIEVVTLVHTPQGPVTAVYLEGEDPFEGNRRFAASQEPFDVDFRSFLTQLYPPFVKFDEPVAGVVEIFDSQRLLARA